MLYLQSTLNFPSWTSPVRPRPPAPPVNSVLRSESTPVILAASDGYHEPNLSGFSGEEALMKVSPELLADRGNFQVSLIVGAQMTRANVIDQIMRVTSDGGPDDCLLFYFAGHGGFSRGNSESMELFLVDSVPGQTLSTLSLRDLGETMKRSRVGTTILVLDTSFAGSALHLFQ